MGKSAIITGGSRGIGAATVREFVRCGYNVAFLYKTSDDCARKLERETGAVGVKCDIGIYDELNRGIRDAKTLLGISFFDTLVCNCGISKTGLFTDMNSMEWNEILDVNINGTVYASQILLPHMLERKSGQIITVSSMWGQTGGSCEVGYSTTKAAIIGFTKALAKEVGPSGIRVNCVSPGVIDTDMNSNFSGETMDMLREEIPLGLIGEPSDVAKTISFLASEAAKYITGQVIGVNGGILI